MIEDIFEKIKPGNFIRVYQKIKEKTEEKKGPQEKERIQVFEGIVIAHRGGKTPGATFTVRKIGADKIGVERIYPVYSPNIVKIEVIKKYKARRAKLYYLRNYQKKLKEIK